MTNDGYAKQPRDPAAIKAEIERARLEIASSVIALRDQVSAATDWRGYVQARPQTALLAAFAFGFWLGFRR
ncbi:MAG: DUF3618 domain-containing protein [Myxococcales bacterium]